MGNTIRDRDVIFSPLSKVQIAALEKLFDSMRKCAALENTINFDDVSDKTVINDSYAAKGVTFSNIIAGISNNVFARNCWNTPDSTPNCISIFQTGIACFDESYGIIEAKFSTTQARVSIESMPLLFPEPLNQPVHAKPYMEVFDSKGLLLQRIYYPANYGEPQWGTWQKMEFTSDSANIRSIRFSSQRLFPWVYAFFDNLKFSPCNNGKLNK